jgi:hypothetical protein
MYARVARKLRVDISYVSRVARGERYSAEVERAIQEEVAAVSPEPGNGYIASRLGAALPSSRKRLAILIRSNMRWLREEWLMGCLADPQLGAAKLTRAQRLGPYTCLAAETLRAIRQTREELPKFNFYAAAKHARVRLLQGYSAAMLIQEYCLLRRCITMLAARHAGELAVTSIIEELGQFSDVLELQLKAAVSNFVGAQNTPDSSTIRSFANRRNDSQTAKSL